MQSRLEKYTYLTFIVIVGLLIIRIKPALTGSIDHFFPLSISHDLLVFGGKLSDWVLMSAPRYFPDLFIVFIAKLLYGDIIRVFLFSGIALLILQTAVIYFLSYVVSGSRRPGISIAAVYLAIASFHPDNLFIADIPFHSGTFTIVILILGLVLAGMRFANNFWCVCIGILCMGTLVVASDFLAIPFLLAGTISGFFIIGLYNRRLPDTVESLLLSSVILSVIFGVALYYLITPNYFANPAYAGNLSLSSLLVPSAVFTAIAKTFFSIFNQHNPFLLGIAIGITTLTIYRSDREIFTALLYLFVFLSVNALVNEFLIKHGAWNTDRYRIFTLNGIYLLISLCIGLIVNKFRWGVTGLMVVVAVILINNTQANSKPLHTNIIHRLSNASCVIEAIQRESLEVGVSDMPTSQLLLAISENKLNLIQIQGVKKIIRNALIPLVASRKIDYLVSTDAWVNVEQARTRWFSTFPTESATEMFGIADRQIVCGSYRLHIFEQPIDFDSPAAN